MINNAIKGILVLLLAFGAAHAIRKLKRSGMGISGAIFRVSNERNSNIPESGITVRIIPYVNGVQKPSAARETKTDYYGKFALSNLQPGRYQLKVPKGYGRYLEKKVSAPAALDPIVLPPKLPKPEKFVESPIKLAADFEKRQEPNRYNFSIYTRVPTSWKSRIDSVVYFFNHDSFISKYRKASDSSNVYVLRYIGWGCLDNVVAYIHFRNDVWIYDLPQCQFLKEGEGRARIAETDLGD
ncbi:MAG: hypothetical protein GF398_02695 [Chitinivibrionales bacterium]|nr:hypothetical protein [Chitinivibrionales bacterium]